VGVSQENFAVIKFTAEGDQLNFNVNVSYLHWISKNALAGDDLLILDGDGNTVWEEVADGANFSKIHILRHSVKKLKVQTMDSGTLYVIQKPSYE
jgi:hypothetical protein